MSPDPRQSLIDTARRMNTIGLNQGTAGNLSLRTDGGLLLTPSGVPYDDLQPDDIVEMKWDESWSCENKNMRPTSEWRFHLDILKARRDVAAIVHVHSPFATSLSTLRRDIPAFHYMVAVAGGKIIKCADYATFGSAELSTNALKALGERNACLLANHGVIACAASLKAALDLAQEVETLAAQYMRALEAGEPVILDDGEMDRVIKKFNSDYGVR
jgi:L-fuculose-phosphate aldolase